MATFTDRTGRVWTVSITVAAVKRVRTLLEVDLVEVLEGELLARLATDPILLCDVVYALCKPEADVQNLTDEDFGRAMAGDAIDGAAQALMEELTRFFPSRRGRLLGRIRQKLTTAEEMVFDAAEKRLESGEVERRIEAELARTDELPSGSSSTSSPGSPESTPAP